MTKHIRRPVVVLCLIMTLLVVGCASTMGPATAKLSAEVGDRVAEMQGLHIHSIKSFFDGERQRVEDFLEEQWIPLFLKNYLATSHLMEVIEQTAFIGESDKATLSEALAEYLDDPSEAQLAVDEIVAAISGLRRQESPKVREILNRYVEDDQLDLAVNHINSLLGAADPGLIILEWAEDGQEEINLRRRSLMQPLDEAERTVISEVNAAYADILKANGVITARLEAAAKRKEAQDRMLEAFGLKQPVEQLQQKLADISVAVGDGISQASNVLGAVDEIVPADTGRLGDAITVLRDALSNMQPETKKDESND